MDELLHDAVNLAKDAMEHNDNGRYEEARTAALVANAIASISRAASDLDRNKRLHEIRMEFVLLLGRLETLKDSFRAIANDAEHLAGIAEMASIAETLDEIRSHLTCAKHIAAAIEELSDPIHSIARDLDYIEQHTSNRP